MAKSGGVIAIGKRGQVVTRGVCEGEMDGMSAKIRSLTLPLNVVLLESLTRNPFKRLNVGVLWKITAREFPG